MSRFVAYGFGNVGRMYSGRWHANGIKDIIFCDKNPDFWGTKTPEGYSIISPAEAAALGKNIPIIITVWKDDESAFHDLREMGFTNIIRISKKSSQTNFRIVESSEFRLAKTIPELNDLYCTGCGACESVCPNGAIRMMENEEGFLFPSISESCDKCGLCDKACPILNMPEAQKCIKAFAVKANDKIRLLASSGGFFPVAAEKILSMGGVVTGAAFTADFRSVRHIIINNISQLSKLSFSKYVQSITVPYRQIKEELEKGKLVLFSGCSCQIAGLKNYLKMNDYNNLITLSVICHGVPSPLAWKRWLDSILDKCDSPIKDVCMRNKDDGWRSQKRRLKLKLRDGTEIHEARDGLYNKAFQASYSLRLCCLNCNFKNDELLRQEDITMGDFWAVDKYDNTLDDNKGVSLVLANTARGLNFIESLDFDFLREIPIDQARQNALLASHQAEYIKRSIFFSLLKSENYKKVVKAAEYYDTARIFEKQCDVAILGNYVNENIGGQLTVLATYRVIEQLGYTCKIVRFEDHFTKSIKRKLIWEYLCKFTTLNANNGLKKINEAFNLFVTTPDWTFHKSWNVNNWNVSNDYFYMQSWVSDDKNKISFAASFGNGDGWTDEDTPKLRELLFRFNVLSVRELSGVEFLRQMGSSNCFLMHDAVFALDKNFYIGLSELGQVDRPSVSNLNLDQYFVVYLRDFNETKINWVKSIAESTKCDPLVLIGIENEKPYIEIFDFDRNRIRYLTDVTMCEWLWFINHSEFVVTDSFHGTCFSMIFNKRFITFKRTDTGLHSKLETLLNRCNMSERLVDSSDTKTDTIISLLRRDLYNIDELIANWRYECVAFIDSALKNRDLSNQ